jgi:hypothetical protein
MEETLLDKFKLILNDGGTNPVPVHHVAQPVASNVTHMGVPMLVMLVVVLLCIIGFKCAWHYAEDYFKQRGDTVVPIFNERISREVQGDTRPPFKSILKARNNSRHVVAEDSVDDESTEDGESNEQHAQHDQHAQHGQPVPQREPPKRKEADPNFIPI